MQTKLVWVTPDAEKLIMYMARVSNPKNQNSDDFRLIEFLIKNHHWSPLEMVDACFEIETSRRISPQILRHGKSFRFQEFSQRYAAVQEFEEVHPRRQDPKNRQNSIDDLSSEDLEWFDQCIKGSQHTAIEQYNEALSRGISKESAAFLLPGSAKTKMYMKGNLRDWIHYINLRTANGTQKEHMDIANSIKMELIKLFPHTAKAVGWV